mmetsp:Transcript_33774/g.41735  ORF Transcript_33774/g.41735 Transcript_33774/m.41735 type:complete len:95 (+) Transcript_33774:2618-2902(+)
MKQKTQKLYEKKQSSNLLSAAAGFAFSVDKNTSGKMTYDKLVRSGTIRVPKRQSFLEEKQGFLEKKSAKSTFGFSMWNKRFCVLSKGKLLMFKN